MNEKRVIHAEKICKVCRERKLLSAFHVYGKKTGGTRSLCKTCQNLQQKRWYKRNSRSHMENVRQSHRRTRSQVTTIVNELKRSPCTDCGNSYPPSVMDFDHLDATTKKACVHHLVQKGRSLSMVMREIEKCELVCSNCHRIRTGKRLGIIDPSYDPKRRGQR